MVKDKPDQTRIYDADGFRQRAACLCVKNESESEVTYQNKFKKIIDSLLSLNINYVQAFLEKVTLKD